MHGTNWRDRLALFLLRQSSWAYERLTRADTLGVSQSEETITESLLLEMASDARWAFVVKSFNKRAEGRTGADWDWWIGSNLLGWLRLAVQAKRLGSMSRTYDMLYHRVGKGSPNGVPRIQMNLLRTYAIQSNSLPVYCLYNGGALQRPWPDHLTVREDQAGCTLAGLEVIEPHHGKKKLATFADLHAPYGALPWSLWFQLAQWNTEWAAANSAGIWLGARAMQGTTRRAPDAAYGEYSFYHSQLPPHVAAMRGSPGDYPNDLQDTATLRPKMVVVTDLAELRSE